jgi:hypothetical protein
MTDSLSQMQKETTWTRRGLTLEVTHPRCFVAVKLALAFDFVASSETSSVLGILHAWVTLELENAVSFFKLFADTTCLFVVLVQARSLSLKAPDWLHELQLLTHEHAEHIHRARELALA